MQLTEFQWSRSEAGHYQNDESLDCQIGVTSDGQFEIQNRVDPSQSEKFATAEELGEAIAQTLKAQAARS